MQEILSWIQDWYASQCNGDWEHSYGIEITTIDNPGWFITIDLEDTNLELIDSDSEVFERSETDWYFYKFKNKKFEASGDPEKLEFLLMKFKEVAESESGSKT